MLQDCVLARMLPGAKDQTGLPLPWQAHCDQDPRLGDPAKLNCRAFSRPRPGQAESNETLRVQDTSVGCEQVARVCVIRDTVSLQLQN